MRRQVRGSFFADYVRTIRRHREADWSRFLSAEDLALVESRVALEAWYPMETFERLGVAILNVVADFSFTVPYAWGRVSAEQLAGTFANLIVPGDPGASILQIHGLRAVFFNFDPVLVTSSSERDATIEINYQMRDIPEAAASYQAMGFYEAVIELSGGTLAFSTLTSRRWEAADKTVLRVGWSLVAPARG